MLKSLTREELAEAMRDGGTSYTLWLRSEDRRDFRDDKTPAFRFLSSYVRKVYTPALPPLTTVLVIGCGMGNLHSVFTPKHVLDKVRVVGIDPDPKSILRCRTRYAAASTYFNFAAMDTIRLPTLQKKFDYIFIHRLLERIPNGPDLLRWAWESARKSLLICVGEPMISANDDSLLFDSLAGKLTVRYAADKFEDSLVALDPKPDIVTVFADNSNTREHLFLLKRETVPDFNEVYRQHPPDAAGVFPWFRRGLHTE